MMGVSSLLSYPVPKAFYLILPFSLILPAKNDNILRYQGTMFYTVYSARLTVVLIIQHPVSIVPKTGLKSIFFSRTNLALFWPKKDFWGIFLATGVEKAHFFLVPLSFFRV